MVLGGGLSLAAQDAETIRRHVEFLASDELEGRFTGSPGARRAADYLAGELEDIGLGPLPGETDLRLPFEFTAGVEDDGSTLALSGAERHTFRAPQAVRALSFSDNATVNGEAVFAGYGLVVPEGQGYPYDSYAGIDVTDKVVVVLRYFPEDVTQEDRAVLSRYSGLRYKAMQARERGARALVVVTGPRSPNAGELVPMTFDTAIAGSGIVAVSVTDDLATALLEAAGRGVGEVQDELDTGNPHVTGFGLGTELTVAARVRRERRTGHNVVGALKATGDARPDKPWVVLGAHYDHLGRGGHGNSLAGADESGRIHNGADDNASGVAALLEAARWLAGRDRARNVAVAFWSGEELGTLGSSAFVDSGPIPMEQVAAYVNFDMVGRVEDNRLVVQAVGSSPAWPGLIEQGNVPVGFDIQVQEDPYLPTDSSPFNLADVPTLSFFSGSHDDYHRPSDDPEHLAYEGIERVSRFGAMIAQRLATLEDAPTFVQVEQSGADAGDRDSVRAFTGTIPDYTSDVQGLRLSGVVEGGPAEEAGLQEGDVIVEFAGQEIANIYDYTYALDAVKIGEPVALVYLRDGERREAMLTPRAR